MKNKIEDLRNHLFATLEALQDEENPMDLERAKTISGVAQTLINSAKVEVDHLKVTGARAGTGFIPDESQQPPALPVRRASVQNLTRSQGLNRLEST